MRSANELITGHRLVGRPVGCADMGQQVGCCRVPDDSLDGVGVSLSELGVWVEKEVWVETEYGIGKGRRRCETKGLYEFGYFILFSTGKEMRGERRER